MHKQAGCIGIEWRIPQPTLYETLEVSPQDSPSVIRAAYRCLVQQHHPDKHLSSDDAGQRLAMFNFAYSVLAEAGKHRGLRVDSS